jgi:hypothetical protein
VPFQRSINDSGEQLQSCAADPIVAHAFTELQDSGPKPTEAAYDTNPLSNGASNAHVLPFQRADDREAVPMQKVADTQDTDPS